MNTGITDTAGVLDENLELEATWMACADIFCRAVPVTFRAGTEQLREEVVFCLLGGFGVSYELALSATTRLIQLDLFDPDWSETKLERRLVAELDRPQFEPARSDGRLRRYRFPQRKAQLLVKARKWLLDRGDLRQELSSLGCELDRRRLLCECPGIGPKTASWVLRNVGLATQLAILDVHVMKALEASGRIRNASLPRDYELVEQAFLSWCAELDAPASAFDLFLWTWQRGSLMPLK